MAHAKLTNGQLRYFTVGETIMIGENIVTNPSIEMIEGIGYKEVLHTVGNGGIYETHENIIVETPPAIIPEEVIYTHAQLRELAYKNDAIIEWQGEMLTCDEARINRMNVYYYSGQDEKLEQLKVLWLAARQSIQAQYPEIVSLEFEM